MTLTLRILALISALFFLFVFILLVRKRSIKPFYSVLWLIISLAMFCLVIFESQIKAVSVLIGSADASGIVVVGVIFFLLIYILHLSIKLCEVSDRLQEVISFLAVNDGMIRQQKKKNERR